MLCMVQPPAPFSLVRWRLLILGPVAREGTRLPAPSPGHGAVLPAACSGLATRHRLPQHQGGVTTAPCRPWPGGAGHSQLTLAALRAQLASRKELRVLAGEQGPTGAWGGRLVACGRPQCWPAPHAGPCLWLPPSSGYAACPRPGCSGGAPRSGPAPVTVFDTRVCPGAGLVPLGLSQVLAAEDSCPFGFSASKHRLGLAWSGVGSPMAEVEM